MRVTDRLNRVVIREAHLMPDSSKVFIKLIRSDQIGGRRGKDRIGALEIVPLDLDDLLLPIPNSLGVSTSDLGIPMVRLLAGVFGSTNSWLGFTCRWTVSSPRTKSRLPDQNNPGSSPRRNPVATSG